MARTKSSPAAPAALVLLGLLATVPATADAFVVPRSSSCPSSPMSMEAAAAADVPRQDAMALMASRGNNINDDFISKTSSSDVGILGALGLAAAVLTSGGSSAVAASGMTQHVPPAPFEITATTGMSIQSSTIHLSESIKTMDFSLPSSYDAISDAKSAATDELTVTMNAPTGGGGKKAPKAKSSGGGSSSKQPAMTSEERAALKAAREAQKEAEAAAKAAARAADKEAAEAAAKAKQEAAAAVREAEKVAKQAEAKLKKEAAAEKAEARKAATVSSSVEFVDMGLPSYSDSAKTEGKKSAFSL